MVSEDKKFAGSDKGIPDEPFILVIPVNLMDQAIQEIQSFLKPGSVDIVPFTGNFNTRKEWMTEHYGKCKLNPGRRIILASSQVSHNAPCFSPRLFDISAFSRQ